MKILRYIALFVLSLVLVSIAINIYVYLTDEQVRNESITQKTPVSTPSAIDISTQSELNVEIPLYQSLQVPNESYSIAQEEKLSFVSVSEDSIIVAPNNTEYVGNYTLRLSNNIRSIVLNISVERSQLDTAQIQQAVRDVLGNRVSNYGVYVYDLERDVGFGINEYEHFPPGSISKVPGVLLALRDIQDGTYTFTDTLTVQNSLKHTNVDAIGRLPQGTRVQMKQIIDENIITSNNTAQYHLREHLGTSVVINPRTNQELGVDPFYEYPFIASPYAVAEVYRGVYDREILNEEYATYFIDLMKNAVPSLKGGIPEGLSPYNVEVANKVGFTYGPNEPSTYSDAAIIYGEHSDYVLVILNRETLPHPQGRFIIQDIAQTVHSYIDTP